LIYDLNLSLKENRMMAQKRFTICCFLLLMVPVFLAACGSKGSESPAPAASLAVKGTSGNAVNMNGTWKRCVFNATDQQDELDTQSFNGGSITLSTAAWSALTTANCTQTTPPDAVISSTIAATLGSEAAATWTSTSGSTSPPVGIAANVKAIQVTGVFNSATVTPGSDAVANFLNSTARCGKTNWAKGVAMDVLHCTDILKATTQTDYWVVDDSGTVLKLYSQDTGTAPYQVNSDNPYSK
jgi:hypothetical protein